MSDTREIRYVRNRLCKATDLMSEVFVKCEEMNKKNKKLKKQLDIAVKALDSLRGICFPQRAEKALEQIKELEK